VGNPWLIVFGKENQNYSCLCLMALIQDWFRENPTSSRGAGVSRQLKLRCDLNRARAATAASSVAG
jgi:hypothetical protein